MIRSVAVGRIQRALAFRSDKSDEIVDALQDAQLDQETQEPLPWFLQTEISSTALTLDEERIALPTDFLQEWEPGSLWFFDPAATDEDKWVALEKDDLETLKVDLPGSGKPQAYSVDANYFRVFPTPDAAHALKMIYNKQDTILTSDIENDWLKYAPSVLIGDAGMRIATALRDGDALGAFEKMLGKARTVLDIATETRRHSNRNYVMGGPD